MKYQLVLQFRGDSLEDYDAMVALENELIEELEGTARVDGHDVGSGETNIFILTSNPLKTFQRAKPVLERRKSLEGVTAAYRPIDGEQYNVIWLEEATEEFRVI